MAKFHIEERPIFGHKDQKKKFLISCQADPDEDTLIIPEEVEDLCSDCFKGLSHVKKLILPSGMGYGSSTARFSDLESLEYIDIKNVTFIGAGPFYECKKLRTIKSNGPVELERYSLLHCFSLKEINCDETELVDALGDTELFRYPILHKDLDVAEMIVDYDYSAIKNQTDFRENWDNIFIHRTKKENVLLALNRPTFVIIEDLMDDHNSDEFLFVKIDLQDKLEDCGSLFDYNNHLIPYLALSDSYEEAISEIDDLLWAREIGDINSPRDKIFTLEDALYFLRLDYLGYEIEELESELMKTVDKSNPRAKSLLEKVIRYFTMMLDYFKAAGADAEVKELEKALSYASSDYLDDLLSEGPKGLLDYDLLFRCKCDIRRAVTYKLLDAVATDMGHPNIDFKKYDCEVYYDSAQNFTYFSVSLYGSVDHLWCMDQIINYAAEEEGLFVPYNRDYFLVYMYISSLLNGDQEIVDAVDQAAEKDPSGWQITKKIIKRVMQREEISEESASTYIWYDCGLKRSDVDYVKFLTDTAYSEEIMPDGVYSFFLIAFDINAIILEHDRRSFEFLRSLTENMGDEDWYDYGNFYFETIVINDDGFVPLDEAAFNSITYVQSQAID